MIIYSCDGVVAEVHPPERGVIYGVCAGFGARRAVAGVRAADGGAVAARCAEKLRACVCYVVRLGGIAIVNSRPFLSCLRAYTETGHNVDIPQRNLRSVRFGGISSARSSG